MKGLLFVVAACFFWALDTLIRYPLLRGGIHPVTIVFYEHLFLCLCLIPFVLKSWKKIWSLSLGHMVYFIIIGACGSGLANIFFTMALSLGNPSAIMLLQKLQIVFSVISARIILGEPLKRNFLFWCSLVFAGSIMTSYPDIRPLLEKAPSSSLPSVSAILGYGYATLAAMCWGIAVSFGKKLALCGYREREIMFGRFFWGFMVSLPFLTSLPTNSFVLDRESYFKLALMAALAGLVGMYFYYRGLRVIKARVCAVAEQSFPFFAVGLSWVVLDKGLESIQVLGGLMIVGASFVVQWKRY